MALVTKLAATIPAGQSLSSAVTPGNNFVVGLLMPSAWTPARVTILISVDGVAYNDLYTFYDLTSTSLTEFKFNVVPGAILPIDPERMLMAQSFKFRSGTGDEPVVQQEARTFTAITVQRITIHEALDGEITQ